MFYLIYYVKRKITFSVKKIEGIKAAGLQLVVLCLRFQPSMMTSMCFQVMSTTYNVVSVMLNRALKNK